ncbi:MAG: hypothetical protein H8K09_13245 [Nitrospira sp.]|nr:hypothetical protein [Nitrospira sp.]
MHTLSGLVLLIAMLVSGCVNITNKLTPENPTVKPMTEGSTCSFMVMGFGFGTNTVEQAMANASPPIQKIRSISLDWFYLLLFGTQCITVDGEPAPGVTKPVGYDPTVHQ